MKKILKKILNVPKVYNSHTHKFEKSLYTRIYHCGITWSEREQKWVDTFTPYETVELRRDLTLIQRIKTKISILLNVE